MTQKQQKAIWAVAIVIFLCFCAAVGYFIGVPMIRMADEPEVFRAWVDGFGIWGRLVFVGMVFLQVIVALIPGEPVELMAGYMFGWLEGSLLSLAGILLGSWVVFLLVRWLGPKFAEVFFPEKELKKLAFLKDPRKSRVLAFVLMTIPGTPKDLLSYFAGLTPMKTGQWLTIVAVSRLPSLLTSTVSGAAAGEENYLLAAIVFAITILASGIGLLYYRKICREQAQSE